MLLYIYIYLYICDFWVPCVWFFSSMILLENEKQCIFLFTKTRENMFRSFLRVGNPFPWPTPCLLDHDVWTCFYTTGKKKGWNPAKNWSFKKFLNFLQGEHPRFFWRGPHHFLVLFGWRLLSSFRYNTLVLNWLDSWISEPWEKINT